MELSKVLEDRRSIREYTLDNVSDEEIKKIINAGILAPSAKNKQPWHFVAVRNNELKNKISKVLYESEENKSPALVRTSEIINNAPVLILVFNTIIDDDLDWYSLSIGACIENMLLQSTELNLGSLWIGYVNRVSDKICNLLEIQNEKLISAVVVGHKNENPTKRPRKELNEVVDWR